MPDPSKFDTKSEFMRVCVPTLVKEGRKQDQAVAICLSMWKRKLNMKSVVMTNGGISERLIFGNARAKSGNIQEKELDGVKHLVIPVVALVEGVLQCSNCHGPELALAENFADPIAMWNGKPVTFTHPEVRGLRVSANEPTIYEDYNIGTIFNSTLKGKKLITEAWINLERVEKLGDDVKTLVGKLRNKEVVEISTGYFAKVLPQSGKYDGKAFMGIHTDIKPDHLAILGEAEVGACSIDDGCGTNRMNSKRGKMRFNKSKKSNDEHDCLCEELDKLLTEMIKDNKISDVDKRVAMEDALEEMGCKYFSIIAVFDNEVIYRDYESNKMYSVSYKASDNGTITLIGDKEKVRPVTEFVKIKDPKEVKSNSMDRDKLIGEIISNTNDFGDTDKEFLTTCSDEQLNKIHKLATVKLTDNKADDGDDNKDDKDDKEIVQSKSTADYIKELPSDVQVVINRGIKAHNKHVNNLISTIVTASESIFSKEELQAMDIEVLEKMARFASKTKATDDDEDIDYRPSRSTKKDSGQDDNEAPAAPLVFELKKSA